MPLAVKTPLWTSHPLSQIFGAPVYLKMEAFQPGGSFKMRGLGRLCRLRVAAGARRLVVSSGGNAGGAVVLAGQHLGVPVTVVVPQTTPPSVRERLANHGATVIVHGAAWPQAHAHAVDLCSSTDAYIHPFDDPEIWAGHAELIHEAAEQGPRPDAVVLSVGGGGLLCGTLLGMHAVGWTDVPVLAVETRGAASLAAAMAAGKLVTLPEIDTVASNLGAATVASEALAWTKRHPVTSWVVSDRAAISACEQFADDHRVLVEPACGAALAAVYTPARPLTTASAVLVIVCGGASVSLALLQQWREQCSRHPE